MKNVNNGRVKKCIDIGYPPCGGGVYFVICVHPSGGYYAVLERKLIGRGTSLYCAGLAPGVCAVVRCLVGRRVIRFSC